MLTKFYAANELYFEKLTIKQGELVATLESPDGVTVQNIVRALNNGLLDPNEPAKAKPADGQQR